MRPTDLSALYHMDKKTSDVLLSRVFDIFTDFFWYGSLSKVRSRSQELADYCLGYCFSFVFSAAARKKSMPANAVISKILKDFCSFHLVVYFLSFNA